MAQLQAFVQGVVEDHFRLGRKLGQGGFATVYLATEKKTGIQRALKFFPIKDVTDDVVNECRLLRILGRHANIIEFHGVYETADHAFYAIAMELMPEGELLDVIGHIMGANYTERDVLVMFRQVVEAVDHCHRNNVVHCDIKLENLFCNARDVNKVEALSEARIKLGDLGAAVQVQDGHMITGGVGTYNYMPPERLNKKPYEYSADVWALGVLLYAMIAGRLPFLSQSRQGVLEQVNRGADMSLAEFRQVSPVVVDLIKSMLSTDPAQRPTTAQVLRNSWIVGDVPATADLRDSIQALRHAHVRKKLRTAIHALVAGKRVKKLSHAVKVEKLTMELAEYDVQPEAWAELCSHFYRKSIAPGVPRVTENDFINTLMVELGVRDGELCRDIFEAFYDYEGFINQGARIAKRLSSTEVIMPEGQERDIDFVSFCLCMLYKSVEKYPEQYDNGLMLAFNIMDRNKAGYLTQSEFRTIMMSLLTMVFAGDLVDAEGIVAEQFMLADKSGDGKITPDEFARGCNESKWVQRYRKALSRMWSERSELWETEMDALKESHSGWLYSMEGLRGTAHLRNMINAGWTRRFFTIQDGQLMGWDTYDAFVKKLAPAAAYPLADTRISTSFDQDLGSASRSDLSDLESPALRQAARLKLHFNTRFVLLEAKSKDVLDAWTELLVANGAKYK